MGSPTCVAPPAIKNKNSFVPTKRVNERNFTAEKRINFMTTCTTDERSVKVPTTRLGIHIGVNRNSTYVLNIDYMRKRGRTNIYWLDMK